MNKAKIVFSLILFCLCLVPAFSWDWPLSQPRLIKDFAGDENGQFFPGILVRSGDGHTIGKAMENGEIVYGRNPDDPRVQIPWGAARVTVIDHESGYRGIYGGLDANNTAIPARTEKGTNWFIKAGQEIGALTGTVFADDPHCLIAIIDQRHSGFVNPLLLLPDIREKRLPIIHSVQLAWNKNDKPTILHDRTEAISGQPRLFAYIRDYFPGFNKQIAGLPRSIQVSLNGTPSYTFAKTALRTKDGRTYLAQSPDGDYDHFYMDEGLIDLGLLTLKEGQNRIEIRVNDGVGNRAGAMYRISWHKRSEEPITSQ